MRICGKWRDFEVLDTSDGDKLERWASYTTVRPDPQVIWHGEKRHPAWNNPTAVYTRSRSGGGGWSVNRLPESFIIGYGTMKFRIRPTSFKHMGLFPEQATNWDLVQKLIRSENREIRVLNLFAYTGGASVACAAAGAKVCHVDASKGIVAWAKENAALNGLDSIRFIVDDCLKFVAREQRRGNRYDAVVMDPPSYGRGPGGEVWKLEDELEGLVRACVGVMSEDPLFFLLNSYTTGLSAGCMHYILGADVQARFGGTVRADEIGLPVKESGLALPCGCTAVWLKDGKENLNELWN